MLLSTVQTCVFHILSITNVFLVTKNNDIWYMYEHNVPQNSYPLDILIVLGLDLKMNLRKIKNTNLRDCDRFWGSTDGPA